tara:strand:+ start:617 stop:841 length:225 start_codon:yes stop_codon:yes gene_type:complete
MIASDINHEHSHLECECGNIQVEFIDSVPPSRLRGLITINYKTSYPNIVEISQFEEFRKKKEESKKTKKLGFGE